MIYNQYDIYYIMVDIKLKEVGDETTVDRFGFNSVKGFDENTINDIKQCIEKTKKNWKEYGFDLCKSKGKIVRCSDIHEGSKPQIEHNEKTNRAYKYHHFIDVQERDENKIGYFHTHPRGETTTALSDPDLLFAAEAEDIVACVAGTRLDQSIYCDINKNPKNTKKHLNKFKIKVTKENYDKYKDVPGVKIGEDVIDFEDSYEQFERPMFENQMVHFDKDNLPEWATYRSVYRIDYYDDVNKGWVENDPKYPQTMELFKGREKAEKELKDIKAPDTLRFFIHTVKDEKGRTMRY